MGRGVKGIVAVSALVTPLAARGTNGPEISEISTVDKK